MMAESPRGLRGYKEGPVRNTGGDSEAEEDFQCSLARQSPSPGLELGTTLLPACPTLPGFVLLSTVRMPFSHHSF